MYRSYSKERKNLEVIEVGSKRNNEKNIFYCHWDLTSRCNYRCRYCSYKNRSEDFVTYEDAMRIVGFINKIRASRNMDLVMFGGETLLHPDAVRIINNISAGELPIQVYTNLSEPIHLFDELFEARPDIKLVASYHHKWMDEEEFIEKIKCLFGLCKIRVNVMWDSKYKKKILDVFYRIKELPVQCSLDIVYHNTQRFDRKDIELYESLQDPSQDDEQYYIKYVDGTEELLSYNQIKIRGIDDFFLWRCECGKNNLHMCSNGDVYHCLTMRKAAVKPECNILKDDCWKDLMRYGVLCVEHKCYSELAVRKRGRKFNG